MGRSDLCPQKRPCRAPKMPFPAPEMPLAATIVAGDGEIIVRDKIRDLGAF